MIGGIYQIPIEGKPEGDPHPRVVVLEIDGDCLVVPAYSPGRETVEALIAELVAYGKPRDAIVVEMDMQKHVKLKSGMALNDTSLWLVWEYARYDVRVIEEGRRIGDMDDAGVLLLARSLLALERTNPDTFSSKLKKKLQKLEKQLARKTTTSD